jgi:hypothetical protein
MRALTSFFFTGYTLDLPPIPLDPGSFQVSGYLFAYPPARGRWSAHT